MDFACAVILVQLIERVQVPLLDHFDPEEINALLFSVSCFTPV